MTRSVRQILLLIAVLLGAQLAQAGHVHADALPAHADCTSCHLHADTKLLPAAVLAPLPLAVAHTTFTDPRAAAPLLPRHTTRNRGPPAFA